LICKHFFSMIEAKIVDQAAKKLKTGQAPFPQKKGDRKKGDRLLFLEKR